MANYKAVNADQLDADLAKVADAIRSKTGKEDTMAFPDGFESEIQGVYDAGKKDEYDAFWDAAQLSGGSPKTYLTYAFAGPSWEDANFKPKYDIRPGSVSADSMFRACRVTNIKKSLEDCGVTLDLSKATNVSNAFSYCSLLTVLPKLDFSSATTATQTFNRSTVLETIEELKVGANTPFSTTFGNCTALKHMIVTGTIGKSGFDVQHSTKLDKESLTSIVNALSATTSGLSITLSKTAVNTAFETSTGAADGSTSTEWTTLAGTKTNWTINLV